MAKQESSKEKSAVAPDADEKAAGAAAESVESAEAAESAAAESAESAAAGADNQPEGAGAAGADGGDAADAAAQTVEEMLAAAQKEAAEYRDNFLRASAELENIRRRSEKKISEAYQFGLSDFALAVGEVRDCLETALDTAAQTATQSAGKQAEQCEQASEKMREGVALTLRKLAGAMDARHIAPIKPDIGVTFDPTLHMAVGQMAASEQAPEDTVAAVVQSGYMLNGRVLRAASVMVATAAASAASANPAADNTAGGDNTANTDDAKKSAGESPDSKSKTGDAAKGKGAGGKKQNS